MSTATLTRLIERDERMAGRVDRAAGVIRGVKILGRHSKNGRTYSDAAMRDAVGLYAGKNVYLNHTRGERGFSAVAVLENIRLARDGVRGDLRMFKSHERFAYVMERAELDSGNFGLSHEAEGRVKYQSGGHVVEALESVDPVALVENPATNAGLFESHLGAEQMDYPSDHRAFLHSISDRRGYKPRQKLQRRLREADDFAPIDTGGGEELESLLLRAVNIAPDRESFLEAAGNGSGDVKRLP